MIGRSDLVPGRRYRVNLADCCIIGEFTATFVELRDDDVIFDTARLECDMQVEYTEVAE